MEITLAEQTVIFLFSILYGGILGFFYDILRVIRIIINANRKQIFIGDIIYFLICGFLTFTFILAINYGTVRVYILLGLAIGWFVYRLTLGELIIKLLSLVVITIKRLFKKIKRVVLSPIVKIFSVIMCKINILNKKIFSCVKNFLCRPKNSLKKRNGIVYNLFTKSKSKNKNLKGSRIKSEGCKKTKK